MQRIRHVLVGILILSLGILMTACGTKKTQSQQPVSKLALVRSGRGARPRLWYHLESSKKQLTASSTVNSIFVLRNGQATTYMLPTGKNKVTLKRLQTMSTTKQIQFGKRADRQAFRDGVSGQQKIVATSIKGIQSDLNALKKSKSDPTQIKALQQYLKINQAIHDNPSSYAAPTPYALTSSRQGKGEQFALKIYPVKTVQYGDANVIMANEISLSNFTFNQRIQPFQIGRKVYGGYRVDVTGMHYYLLTVTNKQTKIIYDQSKTNGVTGN
ncbi:hypothetical protein [Secundilactobacillus folii]|uniref:Lipoprotein n=1 Tax=Secundilactobacillus folii TaxID=2678357 RepID=A0A7X2XTT0_9LACO|nr:hypothetical protein [Secundilactobacillus folii]MTV81562.1 hypothetical protein [Secundilactobacillus folii]